ncbi:hypothetical protein WAF17_02765 [Bernardetia sp. ABR2-2B]|uniref:hypothetical protein n=1 Tax=Bernardetia sp. ABR2-2B TaxID=3127472 RepID=UPI0030CEB1BB
MVEQNTNKNTEVIHAGTTPNGEAYVLPKLGLLTHVSTSSVSQKKPLPANPKDLDAESQSSDVFYWGDDNNFPAQLIARIRKSPVIPSTLDWKVRALYALGLEYGYYQIENNEKVFKLILDEEIEEFLYNTKINEYLAKALKDFYTFYNVFPELVLSVNREKISLLVAQEASFCRWSKQEKDGRFKDCYIRSNWDNDSKEKAIKIPVLDSYFDNVETLKAKKGHNFIYPLSYPSTATIGYQEPEWHSIIRSNWLDLAEAIPLFKKTLLKNQITVKYVVHVPSYFWSWKYPDWAKYDLDKKKELQKKVFDEFQTFMSGEENAGKVFFSLFAFNEKGGGTEYPGWRFEPLDDKIKDGIYLEDSQEANSNMLYALGVPSALIGNSPNDSGHGGGSGSDVREHMNLYWLLNTLHENILLQPLEFVAKYNGWNKRLGKRIKFRFKKTTMQTLNQVAPKDRETNPQPN